MRFYGSNIYFLRAAEVLLILFCFLIVLLSSSIGRPIWLDEFLHFAICSYQSIQEASEVISRTILDINHGQTGVYFIVDYWLLKVFGANSFWLRFPSIISGLALMLASLYTFKLWGLPVIWRFIGILALFSQSFLMYFMGEARPYMPLAAATVCTLSYYSTPVSCRSQLKIKLLGFFSILGGALFHPYFSIYWLAICCFSYLFMHLHTLDKITVKSFLEHCNVPLTIFGSAIYFIVGQFSWMRGSPEFSRDPFYFIEGDGLVKTFFQISHTQFLDKSTYPFLSIVALVSLLSICIPRFRQASQKLILPPVILLLISLAISAFLAFVSFRQNYWIMPRQWVASIALFAMASVWFACALSKVLSRSHILIAILWLFIFSTPIAFHSYQAFNTSFPKLVIGLNTSDVRYPHPLIYNSNLKAPVLENGAEGLQKFFDDWVALANENIHQGGPVWSIFQEFYGKS